MKITANGYEYKTCECEEPETNVGIYRQLGDVDYQFCEHCKRPIAGTAATITSIRV